MTSQRIPFLNAFVDNVSFDDVVSTVEHHVQSRQPGFMVSFNTDIAIRLDEDVEFRRAYEAADLALMDSQPLMWLAGLQGLCLKEKLSGSDLMPRLCHVAAKRGWKCFFLGGKEGVAAAAAQNLQERCEGLDVCGILSPAYGFEADEHAVLEVARVVRDARPDILFLCLGTPKSEKILYPHIGDFGVPFALSVGAAIDFCAGTIRRAPTWMQAAGLEWFFRFSQEPRRLFRRYFVDSWRIVGIVWRTRRGVAHAHCH